MNKCKSCGASINWIKTSTGKFTPINLDGSTHWATCPGPGPGPGPDAKNFKKLK